MSTAAPSISTRISHRFTQKRGWQHSTSVQITMGEEIDPVTGATTFPASGYDDMLRNWIAIADFKARAESERRNQADGWTPPQENQ